MSSEPELTTLESEFDTNTTPIRIRDVVQEVLRELGASGKLDGEKTALADKLAAGGKKGVAVSKDSSSKKHSVVRLEEFDSEIYPLLSKDQRKRLTNAGYVTSYVERKKGGSDGDAANGKGARADASNASSQSNTNSQDPSIDLSQPNGNSQVTEKNGDGGDGENGKGTASGDSTPKASQGSQTSLDSQSSMSSQTTEIIEIDTDALVAEVLRLKAQLKEVNIELEKERKETEEALKKRTDEEAAAQLALLSATSPLAGDMQKLQEKITSLEKELEWKNIGHRSDRTLIEKLNGDINELADQNAQLKQQLADASNTITARDAELTRVNEAFVLQGDELKASREEVAGLKVLVRDGENFEQEKRTLQEKLDEQTNELAECEDEVAMLKTEIEKLKPPASEPKKKATGLFSAAAASVSSLMGTAATPPPLVVSSSDQALRTKNAELTKRVDELQKEIRDLKQELAKADAEVAKLNRDNSTMASERVNLSTINATQTKRIAELERDAASVQLPPTASVHTNHPPKATMVSLLPAATAVSSSPSPSLSVPSPAPSVTTLALLLLMTVDMR